MSAEIKNTEMINLEMMSMELQSEMLGKEFHTTELLLSFPPFKKLLKKFLESMESGAAEFFLYIGLECLRWIFILVPSFRKNIEGFTATYFFTTEDGKVCVTADFHNNELHVHKSAWENPTLRIKFRDVQAMVKFFVGGGSDLLTPLLTQSVVAEGNLNYLSKFGYMMKHLILLAKKLVHLESQTNQ